MGNLVDAAMAQYQRQTSAPSTSPHEEILAGLEGSVPRGWADMVRATYQGAGYNPAAASQAAARASLQGWLSIQDIAQQYYQALATRAAQLRGQYKSIQIPSFAGSFLGPFFGGVASAAGQYYGGSASTGG